MDIDYIEIPNIEFLHPVHCNINYNKLKKETAKWLIDYKIFNYDKSISVANDFSHLTSLAHPFTSYDKLLGLCKHFIWIFIIDDEAEKYREKTYKIKELYQDIIDIIYGKEFNNNNLLAINFSDIFKTLNFTQIILNKFVKRFEEYVEGLVFESKNIDEINKNPSIELFCKNRRKTSESHVVASLIEYGIDIEFTKKINENYLINELNMCFIDITFIINDIYSFKKEYYDDYFMNLVYIIHKVNKCNFQDSLNHAYIMYNQKILKFDSIIDDIYKSNDIIVHVNLIDKYVSGLKYWISGFLLWSKVSPRYDV